MSRVQQLQLGLTSGEISAVRKKLGREPNEVEWGIIDAEWSEHCSYKSSKSLLKQFPTEGPRVLVGPGYDAGVLDIGGGLVATVHIESHNHPSAIDPYGGAATGIGGVLRDIISMGARPVALVDVLRFGRIDRSPHSQWLMRNVVRGIADYGNCTGIATVSGEIEFDDSFERNCLVDVACIGLGRKEDIVLGEARCPGDNLVLIGGSTGKDGIRGATFASKNLSEDAESERSSVQVPDPFMKKLMLDAMMEIIEKRHVSGMKDLGGGGLSSALSELGSGGGCGIEIELSKVNLREAGMTPTEIMISESQERMMLVVSDGRLGEVFQTLKKYDVPHAKVGRVTGDHNFTVKLNGTVVARLPIEFVAHAPLIRWQAERPRHLRGETGARLPKESKGLTKVLLSLLGSPNIASKQWIFQQYDHEVGVRTVAKPGQADAAVLKLPGGRFLAIKADGNSKAAYLDPRSGAAGCVAEACRNVVAVGGRPIAMVDHLQVGNPADPEVYWTFGELASGMADYCRSIALPVVGGKVSFYNQDQGTGRAIKPSPVALVVGLLEGLDGPMTPSFKAADEAILVVGRTARELGGSEYYEYVHDFAGGTVPAVDAESDRRLFAVILDLIGRGLVSAVHDCSKGGLAVSVAEMCIAGGLGASVQANAIPSADVRLDEMLFSESHGRFVVSSARANVARVSKRLSSAGLAHAVIGATGGRRLVVKCGSRNVVSTGVDSMRMAWSTAIARVMRD